MINRVCRWFLVSSLALFFLASVTPLRAKTVNATSASISAVTTAVNSAANGDVIRIPPGTNDWSAGSVTIPTSKILTIQGSGIGSTVLTKSTAYQMFNVNNASRITGITFKFTGDSEARAVNVDGLGWRIDNCRFESTVLVSGILAQNLVKDRNPSGVIDHCEFLNVNVLIAGGWTMANELWNQPNSFGTTNAVYVEDCLMVWTIFGNAIDGNYGGKYVFRYNTLIDSSLEAHSVQGSGRAMKSWEIYGNTIVQSNMSLNYPLYIRGGTGVIFSNTIVGKWSNPGGFFNNVRSSEDRFGTDPGFADGGSLCDGNTTNGIGNSAGTHTGSNGALALTDSTKNWSLNQFVAPSVGASRWIYNLTDRSKGKIAANSANIVTVTLSGGKSNRWNTGDSYIISSGYPARDQIGCGYDSALWTTAKPYPTQVIDPAYYWENRQAGKLLEIGISGGINASFHIQKGRDYFVNVPKPGYRPLQYPHPLIVGSRLQPPENLRRLDQ